MEWWLLLLFGAAALFTTGRNNPMAVIFAIHLLLMQWVKWLELPQEQLLFFATYATTGFLAMLVFDKLAAFCLALTSILYLTAQAGYVEPLLKTKIADAMMIIAMVFGFFNGPDRGILAASLNLFVSKHIRSVKNRLFGGEILT